MAASKDARITWHLTYVASPEIELGHNACKLSALSFCTIISISFYLFNFICLILLIEVLLFAILLMIIFHIHNSAQHPPPVCSPSSPNDPNISPFQLTPPRICEDQFSNCVAFDLLTTVMYIFKSYIWETILYLSLSFCWLHSVQHPYLYPCHRKLHDFVLRDAIIFHCVGIYTYI